MPAQPQSSPEPRPAAVGRLLWRAPRLTAVAAVRLYQWTVAPLLPLLLGPGCGCRFHPTCSHYAVGALQRHGLFAGLWLTARRLLRCHPLHPGGTDPVPDHFRWRRVAAHSSAPFTSGIRRVTRTHG